MTRNSPPSPSLHEAAEGDDPVALERAIESASLIDLPNKDSQTALHRAARFGKPWAVTRLVLAGAALNAQDHKGETPLMLAIWTNPNGARRLIKAGADVTLASLNGNTALHVAANSDRAALIPLLVKAGAALQTESHGAMAPLALAAHLGHFKSVAALLAAGADPDFVSSFGTTAKIMCSEALVAFLPSPPPPGITQHYPGIRAMLEAESNLRHARALDACLPAPGPHRPRKMI